MKTNETVWSYDAEYGYWQCKQCDLHWIMLDGTPEENSVKFCPQCGREIKRFEGWEES